MANRYRIIYVLILWIAMAQGSSELWAQSPSRKIYRYQDVPAYLRAYLDSKAAGKFVIANPGETWSSGCLRHKDVPYQQLEWAELKGDTFLMKYWVGGFAKRSYLLEIKFAGERILDSTLE